jgi:hypothetical protein
VIPTVNRRKHAKRSSTTMDGLSGRGRRHKEIAAAISPKTRKVRVKLLNTNEMKSAISHLFAGPC